MSLPKVACRIFKEDMPKSKWRDEYGLKSARNIMTKQSAHFSFGTKTDKESFDHARAMKAIALPDRGYRKSGNGISFLDLMALQMKDEHGEVVLEKWKC